MDYVAGTAESERVQELIVTALEQADAASLQSAQLVNVTMRVVPDDTKRVCFMKCRHDFRIVLQEQDRRAEPVFR